MTTVIRPSSGKDWLDELNMHDTTENQQIILDNVLFLVAAHLRPSLGINRRTRLNDKQFYGKILWNYLGDEPPNLSSSHIGIELGHLYFAYLLRKVIEAKPIVTRE